MFDWVPYVAWHYIIISSASSKLVDFRSLNVEATINIFLEKKLGNGHSIQISIVQIWIIDILKLENNFYLISKNSLVNIFGKCTTCISLLSLISFAIYIYLIRGKLSVQNLFRKCKYIGIPSLDLFTFTKEIVCVVHVKLQEHLKRY